MHFNPASRHIPGYVPLILIVVGFVLVLTGLPALQVVGVVLLLIAFAVPIISSPPKRKPQHSAVEAPRVTDRESDAPVIRNLDD